MVALTAAVALLPAAAGAAPSRVNDVVLNGAGATFPAPLYTRWFDEYKKACGLEVNYQAIGSGGGIKQITEKTVDFGATDGPMTDKQFEKARDILHIPVIMGAVVPIYNLPGVDKPLVFDGPVLADVAAFEEERRLFEIEPRQVGEGVARDSDGQVRAQVHHQVAAERGVRVGE